MKRGTVSLSVAGLALIVIGVGEVVESQYLNQRLARYRSERAAIERVERGYRRPGVDDPVEDNAATWYGRALPSFTKTPLDSLRPALTAGAQRYDLASEALITGGCAEARSENVRTALRCSYCDWRLGFGTASEGRFNHPREALTLSLCFTVTGHRSAHQGALAEAARSYLDGLAVGCDLGNGSETMLVVAVNAVRENLQAIGKLAAGTTDVLLLRQLAADLAGFKDRLPDGRTPLRRTLLWAQNEVALQELEGGLQSGGFGLISLKTVLAARALGKEQALFDAAQRMTDAPTRDEARRLANAVKADAEASTNEIIRLANLPRSVNLAASALDLQETYRVVTSTIDLQLRNVQTGVR